MNDPLSQTSDVANGMLNPLTVANFTERYWAPDCQLVHPQTILKGQKAVYMAYKLWGHLNNGQGSWETAEICKHALTYSLCLRFAQVPACEYRRSVFPFVFQVPAVPPSMVACDFSQTECMLEILSFLSQLSMETWSCYMGPLCVTCSAYCVFGCTGT